MDIKYKTSAIGNLLPTLQELMRDTDFPIMSTLDALQEYLDHIRNDIYVCIEFPYVEKVFRDCYYTYFSTKQKSYLRECIRISLFKNNISDTDFFNYKSLNQIQEKDNFLGYIILRPIEPKVIAKTILSPIALKSRNFDCCLAEYEIILNGIELKVWGFPHQPQDEEIMRCAEVSIWSIMEYFGNKYPEYKPVLPSDIVNILRKTAHERQLPSKGLFVNQISYVLKKIGLGVKIYYRPEYKDNEDFEKIINSYIESGIPIIASLKLSKSGHAYLIIGREKISDKEIDSAISHENKIKTLRGEISVIDSAFLKKKYVIIDDNFPPYQLAYIENPTSYYFQDENGNKKYSDKTEAGKIKQEEMNRLYSNVEITSIVVPLYRKIYLDAYSARQLIITILSKENIGYSHDEDEFILHFFITSSRSFKKGIAYNKTLIECIRKKIVLTPMPKFIWVAQLTTKNIVKGNNKKAFGMIILDATEASRSYLNALLFIIYPDRYHFKNDCGTIDTEPVTVPNFDIYSNFKTS